MLALFAMTKSDLLPPPNPQPEVTTPEPRQSRRDLVPWFYGLGTRDPGGSVVLYPSTPSEPVEERPRSGRSNNASPRSTLVSTNLSNPSIKNLGKISHSARRTRRPGRRPSPARCPPGVIRQMGPQVVIRTGIDEARQLDRCLAAGWAANKSNAGSVRRHQAGRAYRQTSRGIDRSRCRPGDWDVPDAPELGSLDIGMPTSD